MTDAIKARYRSSGGDQTAASTILFEVAVSMDEQARDACMESRVVVNNFFDHLVDEYESRSDPSHQSTANDDAQDFGVPSLE
jgi:hypothetical protein